MAGSKKKNEKKWHWFQQKWFMQCLNQKNVLLRPRDNSVMHIMITGKKKHVSYILYIYSMCEKYRFLPDETSEGRESKNCHDHNACWFSPDCSDRILELQVDDYSSNQSILSMPNIQQGVSQGRSRRWWMAEGCSGAAWRKSHRCHRRRQRRHDIKLGTNNKKWDKGVHNPYNQW